LLNACTPSISCTWNGRRSANPNHPAVEWRKAS